VGLVDPPSRGGSQSSCQSGSSHRLGGAAARRHASSAPDLVPTAQVRDTGRVSDPYQAPDPHSPQQPPSSGTQQPYQGYQPQPGQQGGGPQPTPPQYAQPGYPPPPGYPQPGYPQYGYPQYAPEPPGRTMGIVGFILAFLLPPAGIVVSAMALSESKKAGVPNPLGTWGLWLSIAFTVLGVLGVLAWLGIIFTSIATLGAATTAVSTY
jgi:hypothetical protein